MIFVLLLVWREGWGASRTDGKGWRFALFNPLTFGGEHLLGAFGPLIASVMIVLQPLFTAVIMWAKTGKHPHVFTSAAIVIALFGVLLIITKGSFSSLLSIQSSMPGALLTLYAATRIGLPAKRTKPNRDRS